MNLIRLHILQSIILIGIMLFLRFIIHILLSKIRNNHLLHRHSYSLFSRLINFIIFGISFVLFIIIWGVEPQQLFLIISSFLAFLGVAFFAQWSVLSNITAAIILYSIYPAKIGDTICILDKDFSIEGKIRDIGLFFVTIKLETNELISVPNNVFLQKQVKHIKQD